MSARDMSSWKSAKMNHQLLFVLEEHARTFVDNCGQHAFSGSMLGDGRWRNAHLSTAHMQHSLTSGGMSARELFEISKRARCQLLIVWEERERTFVESIVFVAEAATLHHREAHVVEVGV